MSIFSNYFEQIETTIGTIQHKIFAFYDLYVKLILIHQNKLINLFNILFNFFSKNSLKVC